jgi:hypothetical protein
VLCGNESIESKEEETRDIAVVDTAKSDEENVPMGAARVYDEV